MTTWMKANKKFIHVVWVTELLLWIPQMKASRSNLADTHLYTWVEHDTAKLNCGTQEHELNQEYRYAWSKTQNLSI